MSSHILVTGASGFLGGTLARHLHRKGADVVGTGRDVARLAQLPIQTFACDLSDQLSLQTIAQCKGVSTIVHCAALSSPWGSSDAFTRANVTATKTVISLAQALGVKHLVFISSPSVYFRFQDQLNVSEGMGLPPPVNCYAATKVIAEDCVRKSGIPYTILRPRGLYGARDTTLLPRLIRAADAGPIPLFRDGTVQTDITHVDDVVAAIMAVIDHREAALGQVFNVSGGVPLQIKEVVSKVCALQSVSVRWRSLPVRPTLAAVRLIEGISRMRPAQPEPRITAYGLGIFAFSQTLALGQIESRLGWTPQIAFDEGLARTFATKEAA